MEEAHPVEKAKTLVAPTTRAPRGQRNLGDGFHALFADGSYCGLSYDCPHCGCLAVVILLVVVPSLVVCVLLPLPMG